MFGKTRKYKIPKEQIRETVRSYNIKNRESRGRWFVHILTYALTVCLVAMKNEAVENGRVQ